MMMRCERIMMRDEIDVGRRDEMEDKRMMK